MDDVLPGVVIDGILGIDMNVTDEFMSQMDFPIRGNSEQMRQKAQVRLVMNVNSNYSTGK